jgi:hypothetical protein
VAQSSTEAARAQADFLAWDVLGRRVRMVMTGRRARRAPGRGHPRRPWARRALEP